MYIYMFYIYIYIYRERERDCLVLNIVLPESDIFVRVGRRRTPAGFALPSAMIWMFRDGVSGCGVRK